MAFHSLGTVDILSALGQQYLSRYRSRTPYLHVAPCRYYQDLQQVVSVVKQLGEKLRAGQVNESPLVFTLTGDGFVSKGVLEILTLLPHKVCNR